MTVKEYAAANHVSEQSVYAKINRNSEKLRGHILKQNGRTLLDRTAQEILKPSQGNYQLIKKADNLETELSKKSAESDKRKIYGDKMDSECKKLKEQLSERDRRIEMLEQELSAKNAEIAENMKRISELTDRAVISENFEERLNTLFSVFENNANSSAIEKFGKILIGKH